MKRLIVGVVAVLGFVPGAATPAFAHGGAMHHEVHSSVISVPHGVTASVVEDGVTITVRATREVTILGYGGEPFVRLAADGAWVNANSWTTYRSAVGLMPSVPATAGTAAVVWRKVASTGAYTWSDARSSWDGKAPAELKVAHRLKLWSIPVLADGKRTAIAGALDWVPSHASAALTVWVAAGATVLILVAGGAMAFWPRRR